MDDKILLNGLILVKRYFYDNVTENNYLALIDFAADKINEHYENLYEILKSNETGEFKRINSISIPIYSKLEDLICHPKSLIFRKFHKIACS